MMKYLNFKQILLGLSMGWLCVHHQLDTPTCVCTTHHGKVLTKTVCQLHSLLHHRSLAVYADPVCWIPANPHK